MVRCKVVCNQIQKDSKDLYEFTFIPAPSDSKEFTFTGSFTVGLDVGSMFGAGKEYYLDLTPTG